MCCGCDHRGKKAAGGQQSGSALPAKVAKMLNRAPVWVPNRSREARHLKVPLAAAVCARPLPHKLCEGKQAVLCCATWAPRQRKRPLSCLLFALFFHRGRYLAAHLRVAGGDLAESSTAVSFHHHVYEHLQLEGRGAAQTTLSGCCHHKTAGVSHGRRKSLQRSSRPPGPIAQEGHAPCSLPLGIVDLAACGIGLLSWAPEACNGKRASGMFESETLVLDDMLLESERRLEPSAAHLSKLVDAELEGQMACNDCQNLDGQLLQGHFAGRPHASQSLSTKSGRNQPFVYHHRQDWDFQGLLQ